VEQREGPPGGGPRIDRARIASNFYPPAPRLRTTSRHAPFPLACGGDKWYPTDAAAAKKALTDAGFDFSKTYDFHYRTKVRATSSPTQVATDIQSQLKDNLGININLVVEKDDTFLSDEATGKFPMFLLGWEPTIRTSPTSSTSISAPVATPASVRSSTTSRRP
jgi:hypothetical protein